jgi:hypothetical protein
VVGVIDVVGDCVEWTFPAEPRTPGAARTRVRRQLDDWRLGSLADPAALLVSELVTNSVRYADGPIAVRLVRPAGGPGTLRVEVADALPTLPCTPCPVPDDEHGRGLHLVACSALRWGTRGDSSGKTVWFELPLPG